MKCHKIGCINEGNFRVILLLRPKNLEVKEPTRLVLPIVVCYFCKETLLPSNVIDEQGFIEIVKKFQEQGIPIPDRETLKLDFIRVDKREILK